MRRLSLCRCCGGVDEIQRELEISLCNIRLSKKLFKFGTRVLASRSCLVCQAGSRLCLHGWKPNLTSRKSPPFTQRHGWLMTAAPSDRRGNFGTIGAKLCLMHSTILRILEMKSKEYGFAAAAKKAARRSTIPTKDQRLWNGSR
jgi:hypothetical protein